MNIFLDVDYLTSLSIYKVTLFDGPNHYGPLKSSVQYDGSLANLSVRS